MRRTRLSKLQSRWEGEDENLDDDERWLRVPSDGSRDGYRDMELFVAESPNQTSATE